MIKANNFFWLIYISLLAVLLPHTAWAFSAFEPDTQFGQITAWLTAGAFEVGLALLTHKLASRISETPRRWTGWRKLKFRYCSPYAIGLLVSLSISSLANVAHSVQFSKELLIFSQFGLPSTIYSVGFGAVLPITSILFAWVLSNDTVTEHEDDPALLQAKSAMAELKKQLREVRVQLEQAEEELSRRKSQDAVTEQLFNGTKQARILAFKQHWPALPQTSIATIVGASAAHVSSVLSENGGGNKHEEA